MGRRPRKFQPNAVLQSAIYSGLAALARLAHGRVRSKTKKHYKSIDTNWRKAWTDWEESRTHDPYDYSPIQNADPNLRRFFLSTVWNDTKRYGNTETKRVYSWQEGTVGPLNALLNYAGARLRDLALTYYPFPEPVKYEIRVYPDKSIKVFPKIVAEKYPDLKADKTYTKAGYPGNQHGPRILLAHPTLPGLDFVDMIRAHLIELCKHCFIYNVPRTEAHRFIRLLIHRLRPYLDWVYTQGKTGKKNFNPESDKELREVVKEIQALYGKHVGRQKSVTRKIEGDQLPDTIKKVKKQIVRQLNKTKDLGEQKRIQNILNHIDQVPLKNKDVEKLKDQVLSLSQREGNDWHRILLSDLHHPASLKQVVFAGDKLLEEPSPVLIVGELPVAKRTGQIDITFFLRREIPGRTIMTPVVTLEIKSKTGFNYNLYSVRTRNKNKKDYGPRFYTSKRRLSDSEWKRIINAKPAKNTTTQLDAYEKLLVQEYKNLVPSDPTPPKKLWKGVIVLDTDQDPLEVYEAFQDLLANLSKGLVNDMIDSTNLTSYIPDSNVPKKPLRLALLLTASNGPSELLREMKQSETITKEDPFRERVKDDRILTLYVSIPSATSSGNAAAWMSRNWHLLHHLRECKETSTEKTEIIWLDLMGVFKNLEPDENKKYLIKRRFGLDELFEEGHITKRSHRHLTTLLDSISFVDLSHEIDKLLSNNSSEPSSIIDIVQSKTNENSDTEKIIVLDGWAEFSNLVPREQKQLVRSLEQSLLDILPEKNTNIIWIDSGVPHTRMNPRYQRKCIKPLPHDSHRRTHLDEIIYNAPSTPRLFGWQIPRREDARIIIQDTPTSAKPWSRTIDVPLLRDFAKKVRGISKRDGLVPEEDLVQATRLSSMYGRSVTLTNVVANMYPLLDETIRQLEQDSMTLVPSTLRQRGKESKEEEKEKETQRRVKVETITYPMKTVALTERMVLCPEQPTPYLPRAKEQYQDATKITRGWCYDSFFQESEEKDVQRAVNRPPLVISTPSLDIETAESRELELRRLLYAAEFLMRKVPNYENLYHCCEKITKLCTKVLKREKGMQDHLITLRDMKNIIFRESGMRQVWDRLVPVRSELVNLLNSENRKALEETLVQTSDILELYGNNLFLTISAVLNELVPQEKQLAMATQLWSVVAEWIPYQLGFKAQKTKVKTKYDLQAIHSNLRQRTKFLLDRTPSVQKPVTQEYGQILWSEEEEIFEAWVIFQDEEEMVGGLIKRLPEPLLRSKWYGCAKDTKEQRMSATQALSSINRTPLVSHQHGDKTILWILTEFDEEEIAWVPFNIEYPVHPYRKSSLLPWFKLSEVPIEILSELQPPAHIELPPYAEKNVDRFLQSVTAKPGEPIKVTCHVYVDTEQEVYVVKFLEKRNLCETLQFADTKSLVRTLRHPIRVGSGLETSKEQLLMWDHRTDIEYNDVEVKREKKKETVSLSLLKPLVHRSRFFPDEFYVPTTCSELLSTTKGNRLTLTIQSEDSTLKSLRVKLDGIPTDSSLRALETLWLNIFALALLTECEELIDRKTKTRHSIDIDAKALFGLTFSHIDEYPRLYEAISELVVSDFDWSKENWKVDLGFLGSVKTEFTWSIISSTTGRSWLNKTFTFVLDYIYTLEEILTEFRKRVSQTIPLDNLDNLEKTLEEVESILQSRGWSDDPYARTAQLEVTVKGVCVVVNQLTEVGTEVEVARLYFSRDEVEDFAAGFDEEDHSFLQYNVENNDELRAAISVYLAGDLDDKEENDEGSEEAELMQVIQECRDEDEPHMRRFLGECLVSLALLRLSQDRTEEVMNMVQEALEIFRECDQRNIIVRLYQARGLSVKAEVLMRKKGEKHMVENLLKEAQDLVSSLMDPRKPDIIVQEVKKRIDRLIQENDAQKA